MALALAGIRYRVAGRRNLPRDRAAVYCANHQSHVDPGVLFQTLHPYLHCLYKSELRKIPVLAKVFDLGGFIAIDRRNREQAMRSIEEAAQSLKEGNSFLIYPEGTRSPTESLLPFKKGGFIMAIRGGAPIVPVAVLGGRAAMRKGSRLIRPATVSVRVGTPVETADWDMADRDRLIDLVRTRIEELLAQGPVRAGEQ